MLEQVNSSSAAICAGVAVAAEVSIAVGSCATGRLQVTAGIKNTTAVKRMVIIGMNCLFVVNV